MLPPEARLKLESTVDTTSTRADGGTPGRTELPFPPGAATR